MNFPDASRDDDLATCDPSPRLCIYTRRYLYTFSVCLERLQGNDGILWIIQVQRWRELIFFDVFIIHRWSLHRKYVSSEQSINKSNVDRNRCDLEIIIHYVSENIRSYLNVSFCCIPRMYSNHHVQRSVNHVRQMCLLCGRSSMSQLDQDH